MLRLAGHAARLGLALAVFLLAVGVLRWAPIGALPPSLLPLAPPGLRVAGLAVLLATAAALVGRRRPSRLPWRPLAVTLLALAGLLAVAVAARGPRGLAAEVRSGERVLGRLPPGPVDVAGPDLRGLEAPRRRSLHWAGELRVAEGGTYRLHASGRGQVTVAIDGVSVLGGGGELLDVGAETRLGRGTRFIEVRLERVGPGMRLRLEWTRPDGRREVIPARQLGPPAPAWSWRLVDALSLLLAVGLALLTLALPWDVSDRLPVRAPVRRGEIGLSLLGHTALVALLSWPLVTDLAGHGVFDRPDGRLNAWILAWDAHALVTDPLRLFQAPAFHPLPDALAFSENLLLPALLVAPFTLVGGPALGYNLALLLSLIVSGLGAQLLVRRVTGARLAAFVGGAVFAIGAHRWTRLAHLHAQVSFVLPFALLVLDRFWERRTLRRALLVGLLLALQGYASVYLGAITAATLGVATLVALLGGLRPRELGRLALGFLLAGLLLAPLVRPYLRMRAFQGQEFALAEVAVYATTLESYAASGTPLYGPLSQRHADPARAKDPLFPGLVPLLLGLAGLAVAPRRYKAVAVAASAAAVVFSLGPETAAYRFLHEHVVLLRGIRALERFSLVPVLALAVLTGLALARGRRLALPALALLAAEACFVPHGFAPLPPPSAAARWLPGRASAVLAWPPGEDDTRAMLDGVGHWRPLVNGDSGFVPRPYDRALELLAPGIDDEALRFLRAVRVSHVVSRAELGLPLVERLGDERVYAVPAGEAAAVAEPAQPVATRWASDGIVLDLGRAAPVACIGFEVSDAAWRDRVELRLSADGVSWTAGAATASLADAALALYRDPRHGRGELRLTQPAVTRFVRLPRELPARVGALEVR